ncbi:hypothetical protein MKX03_015422 [Papaver bracteatum]|nr:hypothetical protein MKX03_015422 [Papaver bracteatum]
MHFFKILDTSRNKDKRLELPNEFTDKYGTELSDLAIIKVLNSIWHIKLKKAQGVILFENGWPDFMEFYSICVGHVIFFRYDGNSEFQVHIFGKDATEIDYPSYIDNTNHGAEMTSTHSDEDDVEVVSTHSGSTQNNYEPSMSSESSLNSGSTQSNYEPSLSSESSYDQKVDSGRQESPQKIQKQRTLIPKRIHTKAFQETLGATEAFRSEIPSFKRILQASHLKGILKVPIAFASSYLKNITRMVISLRISDGRTWKVGYVSRTQAGRPVSKLSKGLYKFLADNHLKEGDVCVFELVDRKKIEMIVHIFRQQKTFTRKLNPKLRYYTAEFQATLEAAKEFTSKNPFFKIAMQASYATLEAAEKFTSENPHFKVVMQSAHIKGGTLKVPAVFATSHLTNITRMVITLRVSDEKTWAVGYVSRTPTERRISRGWRDFVADNDLKEGDVCVFELVDFRKNFEMNEDYSRKHACASRNTFVQL